MHVIQSGWMPLFLMLCSPEETEVIDVTELVAVIFDNDRCRRVARRRRQKTIASNKQTDIGTKHCPALGTISILQCPVLYVAL